MLIAAHDDVKRGVLLVEGVEMFRGGGSGAGESCAAETEVFAL